MAQFYERLKELRTGAGLSMMQLARATGISDAVICKWENGISEPKISYLMLLADFFDCSIDYLVGKNNDFESANDKDIATPFRVTSQERKIINEYRNLNEKIKPLVLTTITAWKNFV